MKTKHLLLLAALFAFPFVANAQQKNVTDSLIRDLKRDLLFSDSLNRDIIEKIYQNSDKPRYKMYPTENIYISLRLDTRTGQVSQVQYRMKDTRSGVWRVNYFGLVSARDSWDGRFELYPTKNMYTFFMIDSYNGNVYQVQWGTDSDHRFVERIYE